jgi:hypothetical protein
VDAVIRQPGIHFLLLGAVLFGLLRWNEGPASGAANASDEERLFRAALDRGVARADPIVRRRLLRDMRFLAPEDSRDDAALLAEAWRLELERADPVVRRRLVQRMEFVAFARADAREPDDAELRAALAREPERWRRPARVRLSHVHLSRDHWGTELEAAARALRARLESRPPDAAERLGDPFLWGSHWPLLSEQELTARVGPELARAAFAAPVGRWSAPHPSSYGMHLVWVHEVDPGGSPAFDEVRGALRERVRENRRREERARLLASLGAVDGDLPR